MSIFDSIENAAKVLGSSAIAAPGAVWDVAQLGGDVLDTLSPIDVSPGSAGEHFGELAHDFGDTLAPISYGSQAAWSGLAHVAAAGHWLQRKWERPLVAAQIIGSQSALNEPFYSMPTGDWGILFSPDAWKRAYGAAEERTVGQQFVVAGAQAQTGVDQFNPNAYGQTHAQLGGLATAMSGSIDFEKSWYLDPLVVLGKGYKGAKLAAQARGITEADYAKGIANLVDTEKSKYLGIKSTGLATRADAMFGTVDDAGRLASPGLHDGKNAAQILALHPELNDTFMGPAIAAKFADAAKITDPVQRINSGKLLYRVTMNDSSALDEIAAQIATNNKLIGVPPEGLATTDLYEMANMVKGGVAQPELAPMLDSAAGRYFDVPQIADHLDEQTMALPGMDHLSLSMAALDENTRVLEQIADKFAGTMVAKPLRPSIAGERALRRLEGHGLFRDASLATGVRSIDQFSDKGLPQVADRLRNGSTIYQNGFFSQSARVWNPGGLVTKATGAVAHAPATVADSFRNFMPPGWVNLNDPVQLTAGMDDMLRKAGMSFEERSRYISDIQRASLDPAQAQNAVHNAELAAKRKLVEPYLDGDASDADVLDFIDEVAKVGQNKRASWKTTSQVYSSTEHPTLPDMRADMWRDDDGTTLILPLVEGQQINQMPVMDVLMLRQTLKRNNVRIKELAGEWGELRKKLPDDASAGAHLEKAREAITSKMDYLIAGADQMMRVWKFATLFRIPAMTMRNITEGTARMYAAMGSFGYMNEIYGPGVRNFGYNVMGRKWDYRKQMADLKLQETIARDTLNSMDHAHLDKIEKRLVGMQKRLKAHETTKAALGKDEQLPLGLSDDIYDRDKSMIDVYINQHPELGLRVDARAKLADARNAVREFNKNRDAVAQKRFLVEREHTLPGGETIEGYGGGKSGPIFMAEAAADDAAARAFLDSTDEAMRGFEQGADWRTRDVLHDGPGPHLDYWHGAVNKHIAHSVLTKAYIKAGRGEEGVDAIVEFLTRTSEGRLLAKEFPRQALDTRDWANRVAATVEHYIPRDAAVERQVLENGQITRLALARAVPNPANRPAVHAPSIDVSMGHTGFLSKQMNAYFRTVVARPETHMVRHPFVLISYKRKADELARGLYAQGKETLSSEELQRIAHVARGHALNQMRRTLFDVASRSEAAQFMRLASPFFMAWQDTMTKWARLMYNDPSIIARFRQVFDAPVKAGWVVDQNGNQVEPGAKISDNHYMLIPGMNNVLGISLPIPQTSFNLVLQGGGFGNPGAGPMMQVPATLISHRLADDPNIEKDLKAILPYGAPKATYQAAMPAWINRGISLIAHDVSYQQSVGELMQSRYIDFRLKYHRDPTDAEQRVILDEAQGDAKNVALLRLAISSTQPFAPIPDSRYAVQLAGAHHWLNKADAEGKPYQWAVKNFVKEYGIAYTPLLRSSSNKIGNLDATAGTVAGIKAHRSLINKIDPSMIGVVVGPYSKGGFYKPAYDYLATTQAQPGSPEHFYDYSNPDEALRQQVVDDGWNKYRRMLDGLNARAYAMGLSSYVDSPDLVTEKAALQRKLADKNPSWWSDFNSYNEADFETKTINSLRTIAKDKKLAGDTARTDIVAIRQYLNIRDGYQKMLAARDQAGGSASPDATSNMDIMLQYTAAVSRIMASNTYFADYVWSGHVEHDPMLVDTNTPLPTTTTAWTPGTLVA